MLTGAEQGLIKLPQLGCRQTSSAHARPHMPSLVEIKCRNSNELCRSSCSNSATPPVLFFCCLTTHAATQSCVPEALPMLRTAPSCPSKHPHRQTPLPSSPLTPRSDLYSCQRQLHAWGLCVTQVCTAMHSPFNKAAACCYKGMSFCSNQAVLVQTLPKH